MVLGSRDPKSFRDALQLVSQILSENPGLVLTGVVAPEAEQMVIGAYRQVTGKVLSRVEFFSGIQESFPVEALQKALNWAQLRRDGRLLQHLMGTQVFLEHEYEVSPEVLIPRPETELLVVTAIEELKQNGHPLDLGLEVGVGSGIISIELLHAFSSLSMYGSELSIEARQVALRNAATILGGKAASERWTVVLSQLGSNVLEPLASLMRGRKADFLISNPPYLLQPKSGVSEVSLEVFQNEPHLALFAPESDPLYFYRKIAEGASELLTEVASIFVEIPHERAQLIRELFERAGWSARIIQDLNQRERLLIAQRKKV